MKKVLGIGLVLCSVLLSSICYAQPATIIYGKDPNGNSKAIAIDAQGRPLLGDTDRDKKWFWPNVIQNASLVEDACDTSDVKEFAGANLITLFIHATPAAGSMAALMTIRCHKHYIAMQDTISTYPWERWRLGLVDTEGATAGSGTRDTLGSLTDPATVSELIASPPWKDFLVVIKLNPGGNQPQMRAIDLVDPRTNIPFRAEYASFKICNLETFDEAGAVQAGQAILNIRVDAVGYR